MANFEPTTVTDSQVKRNNAITAFFRSLTEVVGELHSMLKDERQRRDKQPN